jgi:hypothetical protein
MKRAKADLLAFLLLALALVQSACHRLTSSEFWANKGYSLYWHSTPSNSEVGMDGEKWIRTVWNNGHPLASAGFNTNSPEGGSLSIMNGPGGDPVLKIVNFKHPNKNSWVVNVSGQQLGPKGPEAQAVFSTEWYTPCVGGYNLNSAKKGNYLGIRLWGGADNVRHQAGGGVSYDDTWAIRVVNGATSNVFKLYSYIPSKDHPKHPNRGQVNASSVKAACDKWWLIEVEVIPNDVGKANGIIRLYLDGKIEAEVKGEVIRTFANVRPRGHGIVQWHNGGTDQDETYYLRNWKIYLK